SSPTTSRRGPAASSRSCTTWRSASTPTASSSTPRRGNADARAGRPPPPSTPRSPSACTATRPRCCSPPRAPPRAPNCSSSGTGRPRCGSAPPPRSASWRPRCAPPGPPASSARRTGTRPAGPSSPAPARCCAASARAPTRSPTSAPTRAAASPAPSPPTRWPVWFICRKGVDEKVFHSGSGGPALRAALGLADRPVVVCVSRLVPRKGQDTLIRAWPAVLRAQPDAVLLVVGDGPYGNDLRRLARETGVADSVRFTGSVPWSELPAHVGAGDVFAMPCRTRRGGLDVEGLGIVYLEASATGLPVVAGDSGGAPDAVKEGETGFVVRGESVPQTAERIVTLLGDAGLRARMGAAGRAWVEEKWRWDLLAQRLRELL
ncbi:LOW QUALITY PROTEIN: glycosyl transferase, partial [Streptomyces sp. SPB074]